MKTKLTFRHEDKVLKIDDTTYPEIPAEGDVLEFGDHIYRVKAAESITFVLETVPETEEQRQDRLRSKSEGREYVDDERDVRLYDEDRERATNHPSDEALRWSPKVRTDEKGRVMADEGSRSSSRSVHHATPVKHK